MSGKDGDSGSGSSIYRHFHFYVTILSHPIFVPYFNFLSIFLFLFFFSYQHESTVQAIVLR